MGQPRVTIIIPCFNHGHFLADAIDSALGQTYPHVEVLIVDDGSTDDTREVAAGYGARVRYLYKANAGLSAARNTGILASRGEFLLFLDADDSLFPDMLERFMAASAAAPNGALFVGGWQEVDEGGRQQRAAQAPPLPADAFHALLAGSLWYPVHCLLVRRAAMANVGLFDVRLPASEDWDMFLRLAGAGYRFIQVPEAVAVYRRYAGSMSTRYELMWRTGLAVLRKNGAHHTGCAACRHALRSARREVREACYGLLKRQLAALHGSAGARASLAGGCRALARTPGLGHLLLREPFHLLARRLKRVYRGAGVLRPQVP